MIGKRVALPFNAGPLAMPPITMRPGEPTLSPERDDQVCLPQASQLPQNGGGGNLFPFLRRLGEDCLYGAKALSPKLSDLMREDNTGPSSARLTVDGRKPPKSKRSERSWELHDGSSRG